MTNLPKLAAPAERALENAGIKSLEQLSEKSENEVKNLHGIGPNALKKLKAAMKKLGLQFVKI